MKITAHFQCSLTTSNRHIRSAPTLEGQNYVLTRVDGQPFGLVPDRLVCNGPVFYQAREVAITDTGVSRPFMGQELQVYCEANFINVINELLQLVREREPLSIYRYEFLNKYNGDFKFKVYADRVIGEAQYRPAALLTVDQTIVGLINNRWQLRDPNSLKFILSVKFSAQQPNTAEELMQYLAKHPFVAEVV